MPHLLHRPGPALPGPAFVLAGLVGAGAAQAAGLPSLVGLVAGVAVGAWVEALSPRPELEEAPMATTLATKPPRTGALEEGG